MTDTGTGTGPQVTVAVVSYETADLLRRCLLSFEADVRSGVADVWVVDNGSTDGSAEVVADEFEWAHLIRSDQNLGFGAAVNRVAGRSGTKWLVAANADVALEPGALLALVGSAGPRDGIVAPTLVMPDGLVQHSVHPFPTIGLALLVNLGLVGRSQGLAERLLIEGAWDPSRPRCVDWAHGALLAIRRDAFEEVGGFDERQWMYAEDLDLAWRCAEAGWTTAYTPAARARHEVSAAAARAFADQEARHYAASYAWMARRRGVAYARVYAAVGWVSAALGMALLVPAARVFPARWADAMARRRRYARLHRIGLRRKKELLAGGERPAIP